MKLNAWPSHPTLPPPASQAPALPLQRVLGQFEAGGTQEMLRALTVGHYTSSGKEDGSERFRLWN